MRYYIITSPLTHLLKGEGKSTRNFGFFTPLPMGEGQCTYGAGVRGKKKFPEIFFYRKLSITYLMYKKSAAFLPRAE